jgi:hypothetical protein
MATAVRGGGDAGSIDLGISKGLTTGVKRPIRVPADNEAGRLRTKAREVTPNFSESLQQDIAQVVIPAE